MTDILKAIHNISKLENWNIEEVILSSNRAISMGEGLESFVKNAFDGSKRICILASESWRYLCSI